VLSDLRFRDLGVIEDLELTLGPGMTALTGETGAGKTLVVEALQLVLGGRTTPGLVRAGASEAVVEARFELGPVSGVDEREVVLVRTVPASGRSRAWVDGRMAPISALEERSGGLVDIHGQREHYSLVHAGAQRQALDAFARIDIAELNEARRQLKEIDERLDSLGGDATAREREAALLRHELAEIDGAALTDPDEETRLRADEDRLADLTAHRQAVAEAVGMVAGADDGAVSGASSAIELVGRAARLLDGRAAFTPWETRLRGILADLADMSSELRAAAEGWDDDPAGLERVQARRRLLADLRHKHGPTLGDVLDFADKARQRLADLDDASVEAGSLQQARAESARRLDEAEAAVRRARSAAAPELAQAVGEHLRTLAMPGARFEIDVAQRGTGEPVQFLFGADPGEPVQALSRVASGGELARAMLALRLVALDGPATMVFDEVDVGVGGEAALALAAALRRASVGRQVLVVTHLAQVAAFADHQIAVHKASRGPRTATQATVLDPEARVVEISRMLSGHPDSATARAHADELLALGRRSE
jgi:DNA repair protein RecN (Recombination protein N)